MDPTKPCRVRQASDHASAGCVLDRASSLNTVHEFDLFWGHGEWYLGKEQAGSWLDTGPALHF